MSQIGNWDLGTGKPVRANRNANGSALSYNILQCKPMAAPSQLNFNGHIFDLRSGKVDDQLELDGAVRTRHGRQISGVTFPGNQLNILRMAEIAQTQTFYRLHRDLFQSSFNQLFHLWRANSTLFEMVYDDYQYAQIFRLQTQ